MLTTYALRLLAFFAALSGASALSYAEARAAAAAVRALDPENATAIKAGAHAAVAMEDAAGAEWDVLRNYAIRNPGDVEAAGLVAIWEEARGYADEEAAARSASA